MNNCFADQSGEKSSPSKLRMLVFVSCHNTCCGFGVFFTLLRKPQQSHFKMKPCFRIQIGNTYTILKTLRFFLWESKFLLKFNCNWQFSARSVFPWVANLLLQYNSACSATMHRSSSLYSHKTYFHSPHWHRWFKCFPSLNTVWSRKPGRLHSGRKQGSMVVNEGLTWPKTAGRKL